MTVLRRTVLFGFVGCLLIAGAATAPALAWNNTPAVAVFATPYGSTTTGDEAETPTTPLLVEVSAGSGGNTAWGRAAPGVLKASAAISGAPDSYSRSFTAARFADHFHLNNAALGPNASGSFAFRFVLSGTMRILASDTYSGVTVSVNAFARNAMPVGMLSFYRVGSVPTLYGLSGTGEDYPPNNIFANPDGSMKVYATDTTASGGYYEVTFSLPVVFTFSDFPVNDGGVSDAFNLIQFDLSVAAFKNAAGDFSSTFTFAPQDPIIPDPDDTALPLAGWDFASTSAEIVLPTVTTVATSTGTGDAAVVPDLGVMSNLVALVRDDFPEGLYDGNFEHGWFGLDLAGLEPGATVSVGFTLPGPMLTGSAWWCHDGVGWYDLPFLDDDDDNYLILQVTDNGPGDHDPTAGAVSLRGGITDWEPLPALLAGFTAEWRAAGVDLVWRAPAADPAGLRLSGSLGDATWNVPWTRDDGGAFVARDEAAALLGGGTVRYDLTLDGRLLDSRTVTIARPLAPAVLAQVAPNPSNPQTNITFVVNRDTDLELAVFDVAGRKLATLATGHRAAGRHTVTWPGVDDAGRAVPSGTYLVSLATDAQTEVRKIVLVR